MARSFKLGSVDTEVSPSERFAEFLQRRGKRFTPQRQLIVEMVFSHHDHFDAEELLEHLSDDLAARRVSRPTVYRTLAELVEAGMLRTMTLGGRSVYEHAYGYPSHDHLYCIHCRKLIEFHSDRLEAIRDAAARESDFQVTGHRMMIFGLCRECREK
jgi:Fur family ferric uptake transcriptional regulator